MLLIITYATDATDEKKINQEESGNFNMFGLHWSTESGILFMLILI